MRMRWRWVELKYVGQIELLTKSKRNGEASIRCTLISLSTSASITYYFHEPTHNTSRSVTLP